MPRRHRRAPFSRSYLLLLQEPERVALYAERARRRAATRFDPARIYDDLEAFLARVAAWPSVGR